MIARHKIAYPTPLSPTPSAPLPYLGYSYPLPLAMPLSLDPVGYYYGGGKGREGRTVLNAGMLEYSEWM